MTARDRAARTVLPLLSLDAPRTDTPTTLPSPASSPAPEILSMAIEPSTAYSHLTSSRPNESANDGSLPVVIHSAMRQDIELSPPEQRDTIIAKVATIKTRSDAATYLASVSTKRSAAVDHVAN